MHMLESKSEHPDVESVPRVGINAESIEAIAEMAIRLRHYNNVLSTQANWHNDICPSYRCVGVSLRLTRSYSYY